MDAKELKNALIGTGASTAELKEAAYSLSYEMLTVFVSEYISDLLPPIVAADGIAQGMHRRNLLRLASSLVEAAERVVSKRHTQGPDAALLEAIRLIVREELAAAGIKR